MLKLAEVQAAQNKFDASLQTDQEFLKKYPKDPFAYRAQFGVGWALENQKKYDDARAAYQKVIAATNGETAARAQFQTGETYLAEQKFEQAIPALAGRRRRVHISQVVGPRSARSGSGISSSSSSPTRRGSSTRSS